MQKMLCATVNSLLKAGWREGVDFTPLRIQKMLYFYYIEYIRANNEYLPYMDFEAWNLGPVNRELYYTTRQYGNKAIENLIPYVEDGERYILEKSYQPVIDITTSKYGDYSTAELVALSHKKGGAWSRAVKEGAVDSIPNRYIWEDAYVRETQK